MEPDAIEERCSLAVIDCSFIGLEKVLPNTLTFLEPDADVIALIKPQFEVGPDAVGKGGVVRDEHGHLRGDQLTWREVGATSARRRRRAASAR